MKRCWMVCGYVGYVECVCVRVCDCSALYIDFSLDIYIHIYICQCVCLLCACALCAVRSPGVLPSSPPSDQVVLLQVQLQDGVLDGGEHEADVLGVCGAGEVGVDDLVAVGVQVHKHLQDEFPACLGVSLGAWGGGGG